MEVMTRAPQYLSFGEPVQVAAGGGSRTFGQTVISWVPSTTDMSVRVTVTMGGSIIQDQTLTPDSNQMVYNGVSGEDISKGKINASFNAGGKSGKLIGDLIWTFAGDPGNYHGFIGAWSV